MLPGGVPGVYPADVVVIRCRSLRRQRRQVARGMGARVEILDLDVASLRAVDARFQGMITTVRVAARSRSRRPCARPTS
ncbi:hypothetical protein [Aeromicrobium sp. UC242_57]|uniref:hypothetical protein n=1 Tax=Aeromicrobium sp. UC242_57 TaxID=3374624 RepID=UPI0037BBA1D3